MPGKQSVIDKLRLRMVAVAIAAALSCPMLLGQSAPPPPTTATARAEELIIREEAADAPGGNGPIRVVTNKSQIIRTRRPYRRLSVASPNVAELSAIEPTQFLVTGISPGETSVTVWADANDDNNKDDVQTVNVRVAAATQPTEAHWWPKTIELSEVPGFLRFTPEPGLRLHISVDQVAAVAVDERTESTRLLLSKPLGSGDVPSQVIILHSTMPAEQVVAVLKAARTNQQRSTNAPTTQP